MITTGSLKLKVSLFPSKVKTELESVIQCQCKFFISFTLFIRIIEYFEFLLYLQNEIKFSDYVNNKHQILRLFFPLLAH